MGCDTSYSTVREYRNILHPSSGWKWVGWTCGQIMQEGGHSDSKEEIRSNQVQAKRNSEGKSRALVSDPHPHTPAFCPERLYPLVILHCITAPITTTWTFITLKAWESKWLTKERHYWRNHWSSQYKRMVTIRWEVTEMNTITVERPCHVSASPTPITALHCIWMFTYFLTDGSYERHCDIPHPPPTQTNMLVHCKGRK
jgi:hypothetical protein